MSVNDHDWNSSSLTHWPSWIYFYWPPQTSFTCFILYRAAWRNPNDLNRLGSVSLFRWMLFGSAWKWLSLATVSKESVTGHQISFSFTWTRAEVTERRCLKCHFSQTDLETCQITVCECFNSSRTLLVYSIDSCEVIFNATLTLNYHFVHICTF